MQKSIAILIYALYHKTLIFITNITAILLIFKLIY